MIKKELTSRKKQAMEMRSRIQAVALELFDKEGFENVSVEQIAQAAGCSVGNIYHYFKSKDELVIQVTSSVDAQYSVLEESYLADEANSWHDKLLDFVGQALVISANDPSLYRSFIHGIRYPQQGILRDNEKRVYFRVLRELVDGCKQEGSVHAGRDREELVADLVAPGYAAGMAHLRGGIRSAPPGTAHGRRAAGGLAARGGVKAYTEKEERMGKREERRPPESGREPGENTAVAGLIMGIAAVVFWFFGYSAVASVVLGILGLVWTDKAKKEGYTGDKRTIAFVLSLVGLIGGLVVLIVTVILINVLAVPGITALRDMLGMIGEMANDI